MAIEHSSLFTGTNGATVTSLTPAVGTALSVGDFSTDMYVTSNRARARSSDGFGLVFTNQTFSSPNYEAAVVGRVVQPTGSYHGFGIRARYAGESNYYLLLWYSNTGQMRLYRRVGGTTTQIGPDYAWSPTTNVDYNVALRCEGSTISAKIGGTTVISVTDTALTAAGQVALFIEQDPALDEALYGWHYDALSVDTVTASVAVPANTAFESGAIIAGTQNLSLLVPLPVSTTHAAPGLKLAYTRAGAATTLGTPVSLTPTGAHTDWGIVPVDATNLPELHRIDLPDAAFAAGADQLTLTVSSTALAAQHFVFKLRPATKVYGTIGTGTSSTTSLATTLTPGLNQLARRLLEFTGGACVGQRVAVVANTTGGQLEVAPPLTTAPAADDPFFLH